MGIYLLKSGKSLLKKMNSMKNSGNQNLESKWIFKLSYLRKESKRFTLKKKKKL
jgi:hypothetical protein